MPSNQPNAVKVALAAALVPSPVTVTTTGGSKRSPPRDVRASSNTAGSIVHSTANATHTAGTSTVPPVPATGTPPTVHATVAGVTPGSPPSPKPVVRTSNWLDVEVAKLPLRIGSPHK